jgi:uncharacterized membrane protein
LAGALPLFTGTLLSDWAYSATYEVQWTNFASWLLAGALLLSGCALLWSSVNMLLPVRRLRRTWVTFLLLLATFIVGFINALVHTKDGWAVVPEGLVLSTIATVLVAAAVWSGFAGGRSGEAR